MIAPAHPFGPAALRLATEAIRGCLEAAADVGSARGHRPHVALTAAEVAAAVTSERHVVVDGLTAPGGFAPLSRFWPAADGWIRTHANYPWHEAALLSALGTDAPGVGDALARLPALQAEEAIVAAGGAAAAVRDAATWRAGPVAQVVALRPLVELEALGDAAPRGWHPEGYAGPPHLPLQGIRVLDLTRVIAGPVCTRMLAALGADVLRVDPPDRPELELHRLDGLPGKRSTLLDADSREGRAHLLALAHEADIVVGGYRGGALDRLRLSPQAVAHDSPGTVLVTLTAWGSTGPWSRRRGFDSLVQAASGIAVACSPDGGVTPGVLPCQLLDHSTGYLAAAGALQALLRQRETGGTHGVWVSLARTAQWLLEEPPGLPVEPRARGAPPPPGEAAPAPPELQRLDDALAVVPPPGSLDGVALRYPGPRPVYGGDAPVWRTAP